MSDLPYLVAGGGIAGLAAALGLSGLGSGVRLFEQAKAFEEVGAGLQMSPNGVSALRSLGAWEAVEPFCVIPSEIHVRDGVSGRPIQRIRLGKNFEERFGAPYRVCHRGDLLNGLLAAARGRSSIALHTGHRVEAVEPRADGASLMFGGGGGAQGCAVIAADGIRSTLREAVCGRIDPVHRGQSIYRALLPLKAVPPEIEADCVTLWLCPGGHVVHYPVSSWRNFNVVAVADSPRRLPGWSERAETEDVLGHFTSACDDLASLLEAVPSWLAWEGADLPELPRWSKDSIVLTGDAAHATLPYLAQGAVMALEDACVLRHALASEQDNAFARFEASRRQRTAAIQSQSRGMAKIYHARGPLALARNLGLRLGGSAALLNRTRWIYEWQPPE
jgi:2-polyprenyl-6-methoxyphenol hydroxylase-like FAD-dependent oxidoreductase